jgi:hypothetical protein
MPIGSWSAFQRVIQGTLATNPKSVLDLGIGFGMNGCGIRNWLDLGIKPFKTKLVGVEIFDKYKNPAWGLYDKVISGDILKIVEEIENFDLILMTDVIEHFSKQEGVKLIHKLKEKCNKAVIVVTPNVWIEQGEYMGNIHETHKSLWTVSDFVVNGYGIVQAGLDQYGHNMIVADYVKR